MQHLHHSFTHFGLSMRICLQAIQRGHKATYWVFPLLHIWAKQKEEKRTRKISCCVDFILVKCGFSRPMLGHPVLLVSQLKKKKHQHSHWMNHALQIALFRRILSLHSNRRPLKDFHLGETILPLWRKERWNMYLFQVKCESPFIYSLWGKKA